MKKRIFKSLVSILLAVCMVVSLVPASVLAAIGLGTQQEEAFKSEMLGMLEELFGEEADEMYEMLLSLGIIDKEGNELLYNIQFNGRTYTVDEIYPLLTDPNTDLSAVVFVDGTPISLSDLRTLIDLEMEIAQLYNKYLSPADVEITDAHVESFLSLYNQITTEGLDFSAASYTMGVPEWVGSTDFGDEVYVTVNISKDNNGVATMIFTKPEKWANVEFAFGWEIVHGTSMDIDFKTLGGRLVIPSGETQLTLPLSSVITDDILNGFRGNTSVAYTSRYRNYSTDSLKVMRDLLWRNYGRTFYIHCFAFENFDYMVIDEDFSPENNEVSQSNITTSITIMPKVLPTNSHIWAGGAYVSFDMHAGNEMDEEIYFQYLLDEFNIFWNKKTGADVPMSDYIQRVANLSISSAKSKYYTGQIVPITATHERAVMKFPDIWWEGDEWWDPDNLTYFENPKSTFVYDDAANYKYIYDLVETSGVRAYSLPDSREILSLTNRFDFEFVVGRDGTSPTSEGKYGPAASVIGPFNSSSGGWNPYTITAFPGHFKSATNYDGPNSVPANDPYKFMVEKNPIILYFNIPYGPKGYYGPYRVRLNGGGASLGTETFDCDNVPPIETDVIFDYDRSEAPLLLELDRDSYKVGDTATVTLTIPDGGDKSAWLTQGFSEDISHKLRVSVSDRAEGFVKMSFDGNASDVDKSVFTGTFEVTEAFLRDDIENPGYSRAKIYYNRNENFEDDIKYFTMLRNQEDAFAYFTVEPFKLITEQDLEIAYPPTETWPSGTDFKVGLLAKNLTQLTFKLAVLAEGEFSFSGNEQFVWTSSDENIADIDSQGRILPKRTGQVTFTLTALNGGPDDATNDRKISVMSETITIVSDSTLAIVVPMGFDEIQVRKGNSAPIVWSTNMPTGTNFKVEFFAGNFEAGNLTGETPVQVWQAPDTTSLKDARGFTISGNLLQDISVENPSYTVRISAPNPEVPSETLWALTYIRVLSHPALLRLQSMTNINIADSVSGVNLAWTLENYDTSNSGHVFEFFVTRNGERIGEIMSINGLTPNGAGSYQGNYTVNITPVTGSKFRDVYTVNLRAKNAVDSTWSFDSVIFYAHNSGGLQITVDGKNQSSVNLSNVDMIKNMTNEERLALRRDIPLQSDLTVNYGDFSDMNMADQFNWDTSDYGVLPIYYNSLGSLTYEKDSGAPSYLPTQRFIMYGQEDGKATVTATHAKTGIKTELDVEVETLRNKLYLFQFYPKQKTEITYTNGVGEVKKFESDDSGALALFDEHGIASDVKVISTDFEGRVFMGTFSRYTLLTQEKDPTLRIYPLNTLRLREIAKMEIFVKKPDGTPYTGSVTYSAGVYKNGNYCDPAQKINQTAMLGNDSKLVVQFDTTLFYSTEAGESYDPDLSPVDNFEFICEIITDGHNPLLIFIDGNINSENEIRLGSKIHYLTAAETSQNVVIAAQNMWYGNRDVGIPMKDYTSYFGLSNDIERMVVETVFLWKNVEPYTSHAVAYLEDSTGRKPTGQTSKTVKYPFSENYYTIHEQLYNADTIWFPAGEQRSLIYIIEDGRTGAEKTAFKRTFTQKSTLINMLGADEISDEDLDDLVAQISEQLDGGIDLMEFISLMGNEVIGMMLETMSGIDFAAGPLQFKMQPTQDPLRYKALVAVSIGNIPDSILNPDGGVSTTYLVGEKDISLIPGPGDLLKMRQGKYMDKQQEDYKDAKEGKKDVGALFAVGGYYEMEIFFNNSTKRWEFITVGGGFNVGGGVEVTFLSNFFAGPVPITLELKIGGALELRTMISVLRGRTNTGIKGIDNDRSYDLQWSDANSVNEFLISLRVMVYLRAFAGVGFDYNVVALKLGIFGQIQFEYRMAVLRRSYAENPDDENRWGHALSLGGKIGLEFKMKCLFVELRYEYTLAEISSTWLLMEWENINNYWKKTAGRDITGATVQQAAMAYAAAMNVDFYEADYSYVMTMEDRGYLSAYNRSWNSEILLSPFALDVDNAAPEKLQSNAYPYSDPKFTDDGTLFVYMSDGDSTDINAAVASWAKLNNMSGKYEDKGAIVAQDKYGDSYLSVAGDEDLAAAVWVRQHESMNIAPGAEMTNADLSQMSNGAEIMLSVYQNGTWSDGIRLTANKTPDLSPIVTVADGMIFVTWRSVFAGSIEDPLSFTERDDILYMVYDPVNKQSSEVYTLYNGTGGAVMGVTAYAVNNTVAVAYALKTAAAVNGYGTTDISYAVINVNNCEVTRNIKVTGGNGLNEDPKLTSAVFADGEERFILAYHAAKDDADTRDIEMAAFDTKGDIYTDFIDSMSEVLKSNDAAVGPGFQFVKTKNGTLNELSLIWKELSYDETENLYNIDVEDVEEPNLRDVLKAVKFIEQDGEIYLSGAISVAEMPNMTAIDSFDAYALDNDGLTVKVILLGTEYKENFDIVSGLYTATETYQNGFSVADIFFNPYDVLSNTDLPIAATIVNQGVVPIEKLEISVSGQKATFNDPYLLPNANRSFVVYYDVPEKIVDEELTITAYFADGSTVTINGVELELNVADVGVSEPIVLSEQDGIRELLVPVFNLSDAKLSGSGAVVKVGLYDNSVFIDENLIMPVIEIKDDVDLAMVDGGGYTERIMFDIKEYTNALGLDEIPENGIRVWIRAWVEREGEYVPDYFTQNDAATLMFENLSVKNNNERTKITMEFQSEGGETSVDLTLQNLLMAPETNGNLLLTLYDSNGGVLETKIVCEQSDLISMGSEETVGVNVSFGQAGASVSAVFFKDAPSGRKAKLDAVAIQGYVLNFNSDVTTYNLSAWDLTSTEMRFVASSNDARIKVEFTDGEIFESEENKRTLVFARDLVFTDTENGGNDFIMTVTNASEESSVYRFYLENYNIKQQSDIPLIIESTVYQIDTHKKSIVIPSQITAIALLENLISNGQIEIVQSVLNSEYVGTGSKVRIIGSNYELTVVIPGDLTGRGTPDIEDAERFLESLVGNYELDEAQQSAARLAMENYDNDNSAIKKLRAFLNFVTME